ncbi:MAG: alkaline phosphatase PafA [Chitinophagaceae bacterium]
MKFKYFLIFLLLIYKQGLSQNTITLSRPKLVVGIMVDQMRWDYLYRYYDRYKTNGFKRMLNEGFSCENTYIDYIPTVTAIGHTTVYTGSVPAIHGIAGNDFILNSTGATVYCTDDSTAKTVGSTSKEGEMSPKNLLVTTITDELKLATNFRSKVIGIAMKDRGSILPAGHTANAAYWFDNLTGNWITSTYYMNQLPPWVTKFNDQKLVEKYLQQDWKPLYDIKTYVQSSPDSNGYEGAFAGMTSAVMPVKTSAMAKNNFDLIRTTPYGNSFTFDFAKSAIESEQLGKGSQTDFLAVSLSSPDYVGHRFGVNAIETEDTYLRLDKDLADFFTYIDTRIGKGNYTVFLTADHGAAHNAGFLTDNKMPAGLFAGAAAFKNLNATLDSIYHINNLVLSLLNSQVHLNFAAIKKNKLDEGAIQKDCIKVLKTLPGVAFVVDMEKVAESSIPQELKSRIINGYHPERSGSIQLVLQPGIYSGSKTGTTHGSWNSYDAHIPLVWMGWGIRHGNTSRQTYMSDISVTLAALLHIQSPNGSIGKSITEVLKSE